MLQQLNGVRGVVRCYDVVRDPASLVLEQVDGGSLANWLASPPQAYDALRSLRAVARVVAECHANGIVHRDIKPSNVLLAADGEVCLIDFGIAVRRGARSTADGWDDIDVGTLGYAPPELLRDPSTANTEAVDIYELGALLHEMLLGVLPHMMHRRETESELRARIVAGAPRDPTPRESELSPNLRALLDSALATDPANRPQSVSELLALLDAP
jgi:eukaryotic-like serine/threonine-protein kinase